MSRWKVACINWTHPDAPKAIAYRIGVGGWVNWQKYFTSHVEAITFAHRQATIAIAAKNQLPPPLEPPC